MSNPEFLTALGAAIAIFLSSAGASFGSIHAGVFAIRASSWGWKSFCPIMMCGVLAIYGIIIAVILCGNINRVSEMEGYKNLCSGLAVGSACLASGFGIGTFIRAQTECLSQEKRNSSSDSQTEPLLNNRNENRVPRSEIVKTILALIFIEAIGLYGLIVGLILAQ